MNVEGQFGSLVDETWVAFQLYLGCKHGQRWNFALLAEASLMDGEVQPNDGNGITRVPYNEDRINF